MLVNKLSSYSNRIKQNLPELAFLFFSIRLIALGANVGDALALVSIAGVLAYKWFLHKKENDVVSKFQQDIDDLKNQMQALKIDKIVKRSVPNEPQKEAKRYF